MKKKAASHIEIISAFILFVGFIFFLVYFIQPFKSETLQDITLVSFKDNFFDSVSVNLTSVLVNFSETNAPPHGSYVPCRLNDTFVPDTNGTKVINISTIRPEFSYLYYSNAPDIVALANSLSLQDCNPNKNYPQGNINNLVVLSDSRLRELSDNYANNYSQLKLDLGLLPNIDFSVQAGSYSMARVVPDQVNAFVGVYRRLVLYENGTLINRDFIIRVW
jgi:hypothetical protein